MAEPTSCFSFGGISHKLLASSSNIVWISAAHSFRETWWTWARPGPTRRVSVPNHLVVYFPSFVCQILRGDHSREEVARWVHQWTLYVGLLKSQLAMSRVFLKLSVDEIEVEGPCCFRCRREDGKPASCANLFVWIASSIWRGEWVEAQPTLISRNPTQSVTGVTREYCTLSAQEQDKEMCFLDPYILHPTLIQTKRRALPVVSDPLLRIWFPRSYSYVASSCESSIYYMSYICICTEAKNIAKWYEYSSALSQHHSTLSLLCESRETLFSICRLVIYFTLISSLFFDSSLNLHTSFTFFYITFFSHSTPISILYSGFEWLAHPASRASSLSLSDTLPIYWVLFVHILCIPMDGIIDMYCMYPTGRQANKCT